MFQAHCYLIRDHGQVHCACMASVPTGLDGQCGVPSWVGETMPLRSAVLEYYLANCTSGARCVAEVDLLQVDISEALFADLQFFAAALPAAHHCPRSKDRILPQLEMVPAYAFDAQLEVPTFAGLGTLNGKYMHVSYLHLRLVNIRNGPVLNAARLKG